MKPKPPSKILVITLSNLGDVIMTTPVMMRLRQEFPSAEVSVVVGPKAQGLLRQSRHLKEVIVYDKRAKFKDKRKFILELRKQPWDWVVDLRHTAIPILVKSGKRSRLLRKHRKKMKRDAHLEVLEWMGLEPRPVDAFDFYRDEDDQKMLSKLRALGVTDEKGWIVIAPGAASERKRWPAKHFRAVAEGLAERTGKTILLAGAPEEKGISQRVSDGLKSRSVVVAGETNLAESAAMIARAGLVVANDSAMMHLGFELQVPTVGVFGPTNHEQYGHIGSLFRVAAVDSRLCPFECKDHLKPKSERTCFHGLTPEHVLKLCDEMLPRRA